MRVRARMRGAGHLRFPCHPSLWSLRCAALLFLLASSDDEFEFAQGRGTRRAAGSESSGERTRLRHVGAVSSLVAGNLRKTVSQGPFYTCGGAMTSAAFIVGRIAILVPLGLT